MKRLIVGALTLAALVVPATAADAQAPVPLSPANGQVFAWEDVEDSGVRLVAQAPPGLFSIEADVSRDPGLVSFADYVSLYEEAPGRYEGTALPFLYDSQSDPGPYYWQPYSYGSDPNTFEATRIVGPVQSFAIKPPYRAPALRLSIRRRLFVGARYDLGLRYSPGSERVRGPVAFARDNPSAVSVAARTGGWRRRSSATRAHLQMGRSKLRFDSAG